MSRLGVRGPLYFVWKDVAESVAFKLKRLSMSKFQFNQNATPEANIQAFFEHLKGRDLEMAQILITNLTIIHPLPEAGSVRSESRKRFHEKVLGELKTLCAKKKDPQ
jgi:hypothetical protein